MQVSIKRYVIIIMVLTSVLWSMSAWAQDQQNYPDDLDYRAQRGYDLFDMGNYRSAAEELERAKEMIKEDDNVDRERIEYLLAECAAKGGEAAAQHRLEAFLVSYPSSIYAVDARFSVANLLHTQGRFKTALEYYLSIKRASLRGMQRDEYDFKLGHSYFMTDDMDRAYELFQRSSKVGLFAAHNSYYTAYIDYVRGDYGAAKERFKQLGDEPSYRIIMPFYLFQIEFLEGNYEYVVSNGDTLLASATGEREVEIARIIAEAWFYKKEYGKTLSYMKIYTDRGGSVGREENYLIGYSQYVYNEIGGAIKSLSKVVGVDDRLTQNAAYHLAACHLRVGNKKLAMQSFSMAAEGRFDQKIAEDALFNCGKLQYELGGGVFNEAINLLTRYVDEYPKSKRVDQAREYLVAAYYNSNNYEAAYDAIKQMKNPDNNIKTAYQKISYFRALEYYALGQGDRAYELLGESLKNRFNPKYTALTQFWRGEILFDRGKYAEAVPLYKEYIKLSPPSEKEYNLSLYNLGYCYFNQKDWVGAREWFAKFINAERGEVMNSVRYRADGYNRLADAQYVSRDFKNALANYDFASRLGGEQRFYAQYQYAITLGLTSGSGAKITALNRIISINQGEYVDDAMYELGRSYIAGDKFMQGAATLKKFVATYPLSPLHTQALSDLGLAYQNMNENAVALGYYRSVVERAPQSSQARDAMVAMRSIYVAMDDVESYFAFAKSSGLEADMGAISRDSLSFAAAQNIYMTSKSHRTRVESLKGYLERFPRGMYRGDALFYIADSYSLNKEPNQAITALEELAQMSHNDFTVKGLERLSELCYNESQYKGAAKAYRKLAAVAVNPLSVAKGWRGYMASVKASGDMEAVVAAARDIVESKGVPDDVLRGARFNIAADLIRSGKRAEAIKTYRELSSESQSIEGAESTYIVIESLYEDGDKEGAERMILNFAKQNTPHSYWLGRSFLILGDIYLDREDRFQARATYQSVVDGYLPSDDGVVDDARERINNLGN